MSYSQTTSLDWASTPAPPELEEAEEEEVNEQETLYREDIQEEEDTSSNIALRREDLDDSFTHLDLVTDADSVGDDSEDDVDSFTFVGESDNNLQFGDKLLDQNRIDMT